MLPLLTPPLRIAIVGPESCGKSTLCAALAPLLQAHGVHACWVAEYARTYYATRDYAPTPQDVLAIARGQLAAEAAAVAAGARVLLCDSTVLTCRIWAEVAFGVASPALLALNAPQDYALTLLAGTDVPWQADPLRMHPQQREWLWCLYRDALSEAEIVPLLLSGAHEARLAAVWQRLQRDYLPQLPVF